MTDATPTTPPRDQAVEAVLELLAERWPACFSVYERRRRPLKIGIHHDILTMRDGVITPRELTAALRRYVHNRHYLWRMVVGASRIDLDGNPAGAVTTEEAAGAAAQLEQILTRGVRRQTAAVPLKMPPLEMPLEQLPPQPKRISLADLRQAAQERRAGEAAAAS
jgi:ProP effector